MQFSNKFHRKDNIFIVILNMVTLFINVYASEEAKKTDCGNEPHMNEVSNVFNS